MLYRHAYGDDSLNPEPLQPDFPGTQGDQCINLVEATVQSVHRGLTRVGMRLAIGENTILRVRWPLDRQGGGFVPIGGSAMVAIPAEAVILVDIKTARTQSPRWNNWVGRIVRMEPHPSGMVTTVELLHGGWTLRSLCLSGSRNPPLKIWDTVNVSVDPERIHIASPEKVRRSTPTIERSLVSPSVPSQRVRLTGQIERVQHYPDNSIIVLRVGPAHLSAFVPEANNVVRQWSPGLKMSIVISGHDMTVRAFDSDESAFSCSLLYQFEEARGTD